MKRLLPLALVLTAALSGAASWAAPVESRALLREVASKNVPRVTRDNFVSLSWQQSKNDGVVGQTTSLNLESTVLIYSLSDYTFGGVGGGGGFGQTPWNPQLSSQTRGVSNRQLDSLIAKINRYRLPSLVGNYRQTSLADGFTESLVLTISDRNDRDQSFTIQNFGNAAPQGYFDFMEAFRALVGMKFPTSSFTPTPR